MGMSAVGRTHRRVKFGIDQHVATAILAATQSPKRQSIPLCNAAQAALTCREHVLLSHRTLSLLSKRATERPSVRDYLFQRT